MHRKKVAVVLFNLGGPSSLETVEPFLFNLFYDRKIINLPNPWRFFLAKLISKKRLSTAIEIYKQIGGKSPILKATKMQAKKLEDKLNESSCDIYKTFVCMRYSPPFADEVVQNVNKFGPDKVILLPLYPQYSTTTTLSAIENWYRVASYYKFNFTTEIVCCYYENKNFIISYSNLIIKYYKLASEFGKPRILFSAHSLPISIIKKGDPYAWQIEKTSELIAESLNIENLDWNVCYQSKIGPVKWLEPSTKDELLRAKNDKVPVILVPVAFVSEHSETLVELDIEYKKLMLDHYYYRVPTPETDTFFINCLFQICLNVKNSKCCNGYRMCWKNYNSRHFYLNSNR
ncbi:MAG: ferrochelatase [Candidatus Mesenet longicola]|uniref:Ferrochelatase n=1 Tax=Candidatus Mesenet longicola TaxID=1892558 RepID=A0A8J3HP75_9RICK|nr:MAG: ferrochelatase [Candidatus Mesenet longicola]GHM59529.1 MAG: ferrochelatase [Candidatus Mesenet longicola]